MNKERRKWLEKTIATLEDQRAELESIYKDMPESLQDSERGQTLYDNIDALESATSDLDVIISYLQEILDN